MNEAIENQITDVGQEIDPLLLRFQKAAEERARFEATPEGKAQMLKRETEQKEFEESQHLYKVREIRKESQVPNRHLHAVRKPHLEWDSSREKIISLIGKGVIVGLVGLRGTGKTQLAVSILKHVTWELKRAMFTTAIGFFMDIKATYLKKSEESERDVVERFASPSLLILDELGKRGETDWENNLLFELINQRYERQTDTILIANRSPSEFAEMVGPSIVSRIQETGGIIDCNWESLRGEPQ